MLCWPPRCQDQDLTKGHVILWWSGDGGSKCICWYVDPYLSLDELNISENVRVAVILFLCIRLHTKNAIFMNWNDLEKSSLIQIVLGSRMAWGIIFTTFWMIANETVMPTQNGMGENDMVVKHAWPYSAAWVVAVSHAPCNKDQQNRTKWICLLSIALHKGSCRLPLNMSCTTT